MMEPSISSAIDELLQAPKKIAGLGEWTSDHRHDEYRMVLPLSVDGTVIDIDLMIKAFPNHEQLKFTILLKCTTCIWRLCFATDAGHMNPNSRPPELPLGPFDGPHYHAWDFNKPGPLAQSLPKKLPYANFLPADLATFDDCFEWFCNQTNIVFDGEHQPTLPLPDRLL